MISPRRTSGRGNARSNGMAGGTKPGAGGTSLRNNGGAAGGGGERRAAPGSGLNCGDGTGALELMEMARDQFVTGGRLVGRTSLFGSGSKAAGDFGGGPGLITWFGFKRFASFVSAAPATRACATKALARGKQQSVAERARSDIGASENFCRQKSSGHASGH